jgi:hypothetical protein
MVSTISKSERKKGRRERVCRQGRIGRQKGRWEGTCGKGYRRERSKVAIFQQGM